MSFIYKLKKDEPFRTLCLTILSGIFLLISFFGWVKLPFDIAWFAIVISGVPIVYSAIKGLVTKFDITTDVLVAIALIAAVVIKEYFAAGEVAFIMQLGKVLEDITAGRTRRNLQSLINMAPQMASIRTENGEKEIPASEVKIGDVILIRPGGSVPVDGKIVRGNTSIDQSVMTGESVPIDKKEGDIVYQGTFNQQGAIDIEATHSGDDSSLKKMIKLVEEAEKNKAPIVRIADKWAKILVPVALGSSILIGLLTKDIYRAVTALVVFCPCSLVLATPTAIMAAIGNATKKGILIKSGAAIETTAKVNAFVMDKTGTLTYGKLAVEDIYILDKNIEHKNFLSITASAEKFSEHPLAKAILRYAKDSGIVAKDPESFEIKIGKGVSATVAGQKILIGEKIIGENLIKKTPDVSSLIEQKEKQGKTVLPVAIDGKVAGIITVADKIRKEASETVKNLKKLGIPHIIMLTGDNEVVANSIGASAEVTEVLASRLPQDKVNSVKNLKDKGYVVGMVGDGVNDAPALATSSVSIAMGAIGSDVAIEAADIALMGDDIGKLPFLVRICRKAKNRIIFNIVISMVINFGAIILAGFGLLNPVTAALVHNFGSVFVVLSSVMLLTYKEKAKV